MSTLKLGVPMISLSGLLTTWVYVRCRIQPTKWNVSPARGVQSDSVSRPIAHADEPSTAPQTIPFRPCHASVDHARRGNIASPHMINVAAPVANHVTPHSPG